MILYIHINYCITIISLILIMIVSFIRTIQLFDNLHFY